MQKKKKKICDVIASVLYRGLSCDVISNNFASHHTATGDHHVGFTVHGLVLENTTKCPRTVFSSYHNTKLQPSDKNINTHIQLKFQILWWSKSKIAACFVVFLYTMMYQKEPKGRKEWGKIMSV